MATDSAGDTLSLSRTVLQEVAEQKGVAPEKLDPPLFDIIDPEALDSMFRGDTGHVSFKYQGCIVTVTHTGDVTLEPTKPD